MKHAALVVLSLSLVACVTSVPRSDGTSSHASADGDERRILVTIHQPANLAVGLTGAPSQRYLQRRYGASPTVERALSQLAREHGLQRVEGWPIQSLGVYCEVLAVPADRDVDEVVAALANDPQVNLVQRMHTFRTQTTHYDDPYVDLQSAAAELEVERAHESATGRGVSIAIIDSAVDADHPDLRGHVRLTRNLVTSQASPRGGEIHGTAVAGVIASTVNNNEGIIGVAPGASISALRACWSIDAEGLAAQCSTFSLARALEVALSLKPNVINLSLAGPEDELLGRLLDEVTARGIVVVAAQPAERSPDLAFPSSHAAVLSAHSSSEAARSESPFVVAAPASEVLTTTPGAGYAFLSGNSLAAAHTTGVVALLMEREPDLNAERIAAILTASTTYGPGHASINACRALERVGSEVPCAEVRSAASF